MSLAAPVKITVAVCGEGGVGKSCLTLAFLKRDFSEEYDPTVEDSYTVQLNVDGRPVEVDIIDTAGQEEYRTILDGVARSAEGFIFVYSIDSRASFSALPAFLNLVREVKSTSEDRPESTHSPENNPFVFAVLGNKTDLPVQRRQVTSSDGLAYTKQGGGLFFETSAKISLNVEQAFTSLIRSILKARALDTATRRPGHTSHSFNPNVAIVEERLAQQESKSRQSVTVDEKRPAPRKKNPNLAMDRSRSKSIGGLGEKEKSGSCCVIS